MNMFEILSLILLTYYTRYIFKLLTNKKGLKEVKQKNVKLNKLRDKQFKSIEEQKKFINLKYPKRIPQKFSLKTFLTKTLPPFILYVGTYILIFLIYRRIYLLLGINLPVWIALLVMIAIPIFFNFIFKKFGVELFDITVYFKR